MTRACGQRLRDASRVRHLLPVPPRPAVPDALRRKAFRGSEVIRSGLLTANQLRGPAWRRLFPDVYAHVGLPVTHELRALVAARLVVPGSVVTGRSAAGFWGVGSPALRTTSSSLFPRDGIPSAPRACAYVGPCWIRRT